MAKLKIEQNVLTTNHQPRAPQCREYIPVVDPVEFRTQVENAIEVLIGLLDAADTPREDYEAPHHEYEDSDFDEHYMRNCPKIDPNYEYSGSNIVLPKELLK